MTRTILICGTTIVLAVIAAFVILVTQHDSTQAQYFMGLVGAAAVNLGAVLGVGVRLKNVSDKTSDIQEKTTANHDVLTNGGLEEIVKQYLEQTGRIPTQRWK